MHRGYLSLGLLLLGTLPLHAQQLTIGQIPFRLGMSMQEAVAMTHHPIYLDDETIGDTKGGTGTWVVQEKHGDSYFPIGSIIFRNGRVETLRRDLRGFSAKEAQDVGDVLFQALERLTQEDPTVSIKTRRQFLSSVSGEARTITFGTGLRRVEVIIPVGRTPTEMTVSEVLTVPRPASHRAPH